MIYFPFVPDCSLCSHLSLSPVCLPVTFSVIIAGVTRGKYGARFAATSENASEAWQKEVSIDVGIGGYVDKLTCY